MIIRRAAGPIRRPQPDVLRSFAAETVYGRCENAECDRHARATCASCAGEYCLSHDLHPEHDASITTR